MSHCAQDTLETSGDIREVLENVSSDEGSESDHENDRDIDTDTLSEDDECFPDTIDMQMYVEVKIEDEALFSSSATKPGEPEVSVTPDPQTVKDLFSKPKRLCTSEIVEAPNTSHGDTSLPVVLPSPIDIALPALTSMPAGMSAPVGAG